MYLSNRLTSRSSKTATSSTQNSDLHDENETGWFSFRICTWVEGNLTFEASRQSSCTGEGTSLGGFQTGREKRGGAGIVRLRPVAISVVAWMK